MNLIYLGVSKVHPGYPVVESNTLYTYINIQAQNNIKNYEMGLTAASRNMLIKETDTFVD